MHRTRVFCCASIGAQTPAPDPTRNKQSITAETTINTPAKHRAAGLLAGGLLLYCAAVETRAGQTETKRECGLQACTASSAPRPNALARDNRPVAGSQRECRGLKEAIQDSERVERRAGGAMIESIQQDLLALRKRYRHLGCRSPRT